MNRKTTFFYTPRTIYNFFIKLRKTNIISLTYRETVNRYTNKYLNKSSNKSSNKSPNKSPNIIITDTSLIIDMFIMEHLDIAEH